MTRLYFAAEQLKKIRTRKELGQLFSVSADVLWRWEDRGISKSGALKAHECLGCSISWILTGMGEMLDNELPEIKRVVKIMQTTDARGRQKILLAVEDTFEMHQAWLATMPKARGNEMREETTEEFVKRRAEESRQRIFNFEDTRVNAVFDYDQQAVDRAKYVK